MPKEGGVKHDQGKPAIDLIPSEAIFEVGKVLDFGAKKYDRANWAKGIDYSRLIGAAQRHILQYNAGEDLDPESGLSHIAHAICNLDFLLYFIVTARSDLDDRWVHIIKKLETKS